MDINTIIIPVITTLISGFIIWLVARFWLKTERPRVLVHEGYFNDPKVTDPYYFIKVQNRSTKIDITITHIWIKDSGGKIHIINKSKPLPKTLQPSREYETWIEKEKILDQKNVYNNVRVKLTSEKVLKSKRNKKVPEIGTIAES